MRPQKIDDVQLMNNLLEIIRNKGYAGSSLNDLAKATGLKKASLYHRFPGGKEEITLAVLNFASGLVDKEIISLLKNRELDAVKRLKLALKNISKYYDNGKKSCLSHTLSTETGWPVLTEIINESTNKWIGAFTLVGLDLGFHFNEAEDMALDTQIRIQGSLLLSKNKDSLDAFEKTIRRIEKMYLT